MNGRKMTAAEARRFDLFEVDVESLLIYNCCKCYNDFASDDPEETKSILHVCETCQHQIDTVVERHQERFARLASKETRK
jgi:hypothetical protein